MPGPWLLLRELCWSTEYGPMECAADARRECDTVWGGAVQKKLESVAGWLPKWYSYEADGAIMGFWSMDATDALP